MKIITDHLSERALEIATPKKPEKFLSEHASQKPLQQKIKDKWPKLRLITTEQADRKLKEGKSIAIKPGETVNGIKNLGSYTVYVNNSPKVELNNKSPQQKINEMDLPRDVKYDYDITATVEHLTIALNGLIEALESLKEK